MSEKSFRAGLTIFAATLLVSVASRSDVVRPSVMIVPARHTIMQIAFDMVRLRGVSLVSYRESRVDGTLVVYSWDAAGRRWVRTAGGGQGVTSPFGDARFAVAIVPDIDNADLILQDEAWSGKIYEIPTMDIATIANKLNEIYDFSAYEWRWLAARYRLRLEDLNYERRRYGRYGPPGTAPKRSYPSVETVTTVFPESPADEVSEFTENVEVRSVAVPELIEEKGAGYTAEEPAVEVQDEKPVEVSPLQEALPEDK